MNDNIPTPSRRNVIKGLAGGATVAGIGGAGLLAMSGGAAASGEFSYGDVTISSDDGTVEYVAIYGDSKVTWDGFESEATDFSLTIDATLEGDGAHGPIRIYETGATSASELNDGTVGKIGLDSDWGDNETLSGSGTSGHIQSSIGLASDGSHDATTDWHIVGTDPDGYGLPFKSIPASALEVGTDGASGTYTVTLTSTYAWYDSSGAEIFSKSFDSHVHVTVNDEPTTAGTSDGSGTDGATGA